MGGSVEGGKASLSRAQREEHPHEEELQVIAAGFRAGRDGGQCSGGHPRLGGTGPRGLQEGPRCLCLCSRV